MKLKAQIALDHHIGKLICYLLVPVVRVYGLLLRPRHSVSAEDVKVIVIAKYFGLGSILQATPLLRGLRAAYPNAKLIFLSRKANRPIFPHLAEVDSVRLVDDSSVFSLLGSSFRICAGFWRRRVDLFFDLELYSCFGALLSILSGSRTRLGFYSGRRSDFKCGLYNGLLFLNNQMPIRKCYLQLGRMAHVAPEASEELSSLVFPPEQERSMSRRLRELVGDDADGKWIAVNINASELAFHRRWPLENFVTVARHFAAQGCRVFFVGSPSERDYVQKAVDQLAEFPQVWNAAGVFPFSEFLLFLRRCDALLTNDSGIMNFGFALRTRTLSLLGPVDWIQYQIPGTEFAFIRKPVYCSPCLHILNSCLHAGDTGIAPCMALISPDEVIANLQALLNGGEAPSPAPGVVDSIDGKCLGVLYSKIKIR